MLERHGDESGVPYLELGWGSFPLLLPAKGVVTQLNASKPWFICSLIHKFQGKEDKVESYVAGFLEEVKRSLSPDFKAKWNWPEKMESPKVESSSALSYSPPDDWAACSKATGLTYCNTISGIE
jgi:hypothetical protein